MEFSHFGYLLLIFAGFPLGYLARQWRVSREEHYARMEGMHGEELREYMARRRKEHDYSLVEVWLMVFCPILGLVLFLRENRAAVDALMAH